MNVKEIMKKDATLVAPFTSLQDMAEKMANTREALSEFLADHERHVNELSGAIRREDGTPPNSGDFKQVLSQGQVVMAGLSGHKAILKAMKANEDQTNRKYGKEVEKRFGETIELLLRKGLADERRHLAWLETTLKSL